MPAVSSQITLHPYDKAGLFAAFNQARKLVREGKIDPARLNRALGVAQRTRARPVSYITTLTACSCPDFHFNRRRPCKHIYALMLKELAV